MACANTENVLKSQDVTTDREKKRNQTSLMVAIDNGYFEMAKALIGAIREAGAARCF